VNKWITTIEWQLYKLKIIIKFLTFETGKNFTGLEANIYGKSFLKL